MTKWKKAVGDAFESRVSLRLLSVRLFFPWATGTTRKHTTIGQLSPNTQRHLGSYVELLSGVHSPDGPCCTLCRVVPHTTTVEE